MGALVQVVVDACEEELDKIANAIYGEMVGIVAGRPYATGEAAGAIHIEANGMSRFIGGNHNHLYWLNEGNGASPIKSTRKRDRLGREPGKLDTRFGYKSSVSAYKGIHFVERIASHY